MSAARRARGAEGPVIVRRQLHGWTDDAVKAMQDNPRYFAWWDRWKTVALMGALGALAYQVMRGR